MGNCYNYTPIPPAEASCIIAHLFVELALPCSCCKREDGVIVIQGKTYDGSSARVTRASRGAYPAAAERIASRTSRGSLSLSR